MAEAAATARHGSATRFVLPVCLWLLLSWLAGASSDIGVPVALALTWVMTAVLTPRSRSLMRGTGYAAVAAIPVNLVMIAIQYRDHLSLSTRWPFLMVVVLTIAAYCYRDIKTRRAASSNST